MSFEAFLESDPTGVDHNEFQRWFMPLGPKIAEHLGYMPQPDGCWQGGTPIDVMYADMPYRLRCDPASMRGRMNISYGQHPHTSYEATLLPIGEKDTKYTGVFWKEAPDDKFQSSVLLGTLEQAALPDIQEAHRRLQKLTRRILDPTAEEGVIL